MPEQEWEISLFFKEIRMHPWLRLFPVAGLAVLTGCAMFEIPTMEDMQRSRAEAARREVTDPDPRKRAAAVEDLGEDRTAEVVPMIRTALKDSEGTVRAAAARALSEVGTEGEVARADLMESLRAEKDPEAAVAMAWTLKRWKVDLTPGLESLRRVVQQPDPFWRYQAALLMSPYVEVTEVAPVYLDTVGTWAEKDLRNKPIDVLGDLIPSDGPKLITLLEAGAARTNAKQRAAVAKLFSDYRPTPDAGKKVIVTLFADPDPRVRAAAAHAALMSVPSLDAAAPGLLQLLGDPDAEVRAQAASAIGPLVARKVAPAGALEALAKGMADAEAKVRESTALSLGHVGDLPEPVARQVLARLDPLVESSVGVRATAAAGLARAPVTDEWKKALLRAMKDPEDQVKERAMTTVGHAGVRDPEMVALVLSRTSAATPKGQRLTAIGVLNDLQWKRADIVAALARLGTDPDADVREAAAFALKQVEAGQP